jgi:hypothetical protein
MANKPLGAHCQVLQERRTCPSSSVDRTPFEGLAGSYKRNEIKLGKHLGKGAFAEVYSEPLKYVAQIASAISYLHERDIIYRDLKPKNVGIDVHGNVKLFGFGFARLLPHERNDNDTFKMTGRIGTLRYMGPEVALKEPYNLKADVYSWSVILWECFLSNTLTKLFHVRQF